MTKMEELMAQSKLMAMLKREEDEQRTRHCILVALAIVGAVALVALIAYVVYRMMSDDCDEFDDDELYFDDDLEDLFEEDEDMEDEEIIEIKPEVKAEEEE